MFGYVVINKPELKVKEFYEYKAFYCGLCRVLKNNYGQLGQMTLSYDMTFLIILLTSLYECETKRIKNRCVVHPVRKQETLRNEITDYVADMNIALTYHHLMDDWQDERSILGLTGAGALQRGYKKVSRKYPEKCSIIRECLNQLKDCEDRGETNIDTVSRCFGKLMAELFTYRKDRWENNLRKIGFYLGKFIYILDAYDDIEKDMKNKSYNPFLADYGKESFHQECGDMLTLMMAECSREFEQLPCVMDITILRNILYEGVWNKYNKIQEERMKRKEQSYDSKSISGT
jgi:hypothetical protein